MRQNPNYALCKIDESFYLLPYGQAVADHERGIQINEAGVFLWNTLKTSHTEKELLEKFLAHYQPEEEEIPVLTQDLSNFLLPMTSLGIVIKDWYEYSGTAAFVTYLQIGPLCLKLTADSNIFPKEFSAFQTKASDKIDLTIALGTTNPPIHELGTLLIQNRDLHVWEQSDGYQLLFPEAKEITEAHLSIDGSFACIYHIPHYTKTLTEELLHTVRLLYLYTAGLHGCYALHSASILYQDKAWLFSGRSGMGKSTHTNLWKELFDTPILNGDLNLLAFSDNKPIVYGIPWCGTSGISVTQTYSLGGIILLSRDTEDTCVKLATDQKTLLISQRLISPNWKAIMLQKQLQFAEALSKHILVCKLKCTKNNSAAYTIKAWIDSYLDK